MNSGNEELVDALRLIAHDGAGNTALAVEIADWLEQRIAEAPRRPRRGSERAGRSSGSAATRRGARRRWLDDLAQAAGLVLGLF
jgi:hypothetical protein